ncbi:MAG: WYL domain-containing protein [Armatimonadota bacterium]|nr:WYL domain-containing protein [bacterium]
MAKSALLIRMMDILRVRPGVSVRELATILDRSPRTVYRWLNELTAELGAAIRCHDGGYFLTGGREARRVDLTPQELLVLRLGLKSSLFGDGSPIAKHAESAWQKIRSAVCYDELIASRDLASSHSVKVSVPAADIEPNILETLENAANNRHRLRIVYRSQHSGCVKDYTIDPYAIVFRRHSWYVVGFCHEHDDIAMFKLVRFHSVANTGMIFTRPADFNLDDYFELSWEAWAGGDSVDVKVRFSPKVAEMIAESKRHPTQVIHFEPDGSIVFEATVSGIEEIAIWVMGYGKEAEVIAPEALRSYIYEHAAGMIEYYGKLQKKAEEVLAN